MTTLSIAYFPPISYFSLLSKGDVFLEAHETYQKQSWRNRCRILTANGPEYLSFPVIHVEGTFKHPIGETLVDYKTPWLLRHKRAIDSAYRSSAYFDYFRDPLYAILDSKPERLWDLDSEIINFFCDALRIARPGITSEYAGPCVDIHPKHTDPVYKENPYFQVFGQKWGFTGNLSIMDLLFNEGPDGVTLLY